MRSKKLFVAVCAALFIGAVSAKDVGKPAPAFDLPAAGAQKVRLADLKGRVVLVDFWASWCAPCKQSFPWMNEMQAKYGPKGLTIVGINVDKKREDADKFLTGTPAKFTVADVQTAKRIGDRLLQSFGRERRTASRSTIARACTRLSSPSRTLGIAIPGGRNAGPSSAK